MHVPAPEEPGVIPAVPSSHKTVRAAVLKWFNTGHEKTSNVGEKSRNISLPAMCSSEKKTPIDIPDRQTDR